MRGTRVCTIFATAIATLTVGTAQAQVSSFRADGGRDLLNPIPYPHNRVGEVNRDGANGRMWIGRGFIGGERTYRPIDWAGPGPDRYGAAENDGSIVYTRRGFTTVAFTPWVQITGADRGPSVGLEDFERARAQWLRENGYTGGVRTIVNPAASAGSSVASRGDIKPRGTIRMKQQRRGSDRPLMVLLPGDRVSMPNLLGGDHAVRVAAR